jgi:hypothetical protein
MPEEVRMPLISKRHEQFCSSEEPLMIGKQNEQFSVRTAHFACLSAASSQLNPAALPGKYLALCLISTNIPGSSDASDALQGAHTLGRRGHWDRRQFCTLFNLIIITF